MVVETVKILEIVMPTSVALATLLFGFLAYVQHAGYRSRILKGSILATVVLFLLTNITGVFVLWESLNVVYPLFFYLSGLFSLLFSSFYAIMLKVSALEK